MLQLISGKNILDYMKAYDKLLIERSSYEKLDHNTTNPANFSTKKRQYAVDPIDVLSMKLTPFVGTKTLMCRFECKSEQKIYDTVIQFTNVIYEEEDTRDNVTFLASDKQKYHIQPINLAEGSVTVRCTCLDFYYRFSHYDSKDKALFGRPPKPYVKKTDRPPVNPNRVSGICKHIMASIRELRQTRIVF